ncbi:MAG: hypothetical protein KAX39_05595 [candidate division Zixibacteria bacterium]|nr:hypothetical protein [candidate division Zixibacteria bacterium]
MKDQITTSSGVLITSKMNHHPEPTGSSFRVTEPCCACQFPGSTGSCRQIKGPGGHGNL